MVAVPAVDPDDGRPVTIGRRIGGRASENLSPSRGGSIDYYDSPGRFDDMVGRIIELGMDEIGLYYPLDDRQVATFERIATDVLPRLRASSATV